MLSPSGDWDEAVILGYLLGYITYLTGIRYGKVNFSVSLLG